MSGLFLKASSLRALEGQRACTQPRRLQLTGVRAHSAAMAARRAGTIGGSDTISLFSVGSSNIEEPFDHAFQELNANTKRARTLAKGSK